jgi:chromate transporter
VSTHEQTTDHNESHQAKYIPLPELLRVFLSLGFLGFGGPAAHLALMERELVGRRAWLSRSDFLDLLAAINLVPGPNSTEMALHIGLLTHGFPGMMAAAIGFIGPAVLLSSILGMIYVSAGSVPAVASLLNGIKPVVLVLILSAAYRLGRSAIDSTPMRILLIVALVLTALTSAPLMGLLGLAPLTISELAILLLTGSAYVLFRQFRQRDLSLSAVLLSVPLAPLEQFALLSASVPNLPGLFGQFFLIGATLFGSGYVIVAYMQRSFVETLGWLTPQQLIDMVAIGQATPGPVSSTAAAAGYVMTAIPGNLLSGVPGAAISAVAVFLPAFIIVAILGRLVPYLKRYPVALDFLKGVNAGVIALLLGTLFNLAWATLIRPSGGIDWLSLIVAGIMFVALERFNVSSLILIVVGALIGLGRIAVNI